MSDCLFCKIVAGDIPADIVYQNDRALAFRDIRPQAPVHVLVIPKIHVATLNDLPVDDARLGAALWEAVQQVAKLEGIAESGYRTAINCGADGGQEVYHLHLHVLGKRRLAWPPG